MERFQPSQFSGYGAEEAPIEGSEPPVEGAKKKIDPAQIIPWIAVGKEAIFGGKSERESVAAIQADIEKYKKMRKTAPDWPVVLGIVPPGSKLAYTNKIRDLEARLIAAQEQAGEERTWESTKQALLLVAVFGSIAGVLVIGGVALNQVKKAQLQQAHIERIRRGSGE